MVKINKFKVTIMLLCFPSISINVVFIFLTKTSSSNLNSFSSSPFNYLRISLFSFLILLSAFCFVPDHSCQCTDMLFLQSYRIKNLLDPIFPTYYHSLSFVPFYSKLLTCPYSPELFFSQSLKSTLVRLN